MGCTLRDITNRLYSKKVECVDDEGQEYFYQAQFKNFKDICETLDINILDPHHLHIQPF